MENTSVEATGQSPKEAATPDSYETRCGKLAEYFVEHLGDDKNTPRDGVEKLLTRIQAEVGLADYKFKYRQADHSKPFLYTPLVVSIATLVLAVGLGIVTVYQTIHKPPDAEAQRAFLSREEQETRANLVLKVLEAPPEAREPLLDFLRKAKLLSLEPEQQKDLEKLVQKAQQIAR